MKMLNILDQSTSDSIRERYIRCFIDENSEHYHTLIEKKISYIDGFCYKGYLWDCCKMPVIITEGQADRIMQTKKNVYIMWDINSCENIFIPGYWKYPKSKILFAQRWFKDYERVLPEDIYLFDDSFEWSVVYTHETMLDNSRYCLYLDNYSPRELFGYNLNRNKVLTKKL